MKSIQKPTTIAPEISLYNVWWWTSGYIVCFSFAATIHYLHCPDVDCLLILGGVRSCWPWHKSGKVVRCRRCDDARFIWASLLKYTANDTWFWLLLRKGLSLSNRFWVRGPLLQIHVVEVGPRELCVVSEYFTIVLSENLHTPEFSVVLAPPWIGPAFPPIEAWFCFESLILYSSTCIVVKIVYIILKFLNQAIYICSWLPESGPRSTFMTFVVHTCRVA
jgi:hypothetical protein